MYRNNPYSEISIWRFTVNDMLINVLEIATTRPDHGKHTLIIYWFSSVYRVITVQ